MIDAKKLDVLKGKVETLLHELIDGEGGNLADAVVILSLSLLDHAVTGACLDGEASADALLETSIKLMRGRLPGVAAATLADLESRWH